MKETKFKNENNERGITLVALVVTIIVLMMLAGITISLVLGQNGIITKAQQSKDLSTNAQKATEEGLNFLDNEMTTAIGEQSVSMASGKNVLSNTNNISLKDDNGNTVTIPAGFKIASDSATKQEDGIVIEDKDGNQFVWIPVANVSNYARTDFGKDAISYTNFSEAIPSDEQTSVSIYHGYYIGRYETGDSVSTANKILRAGGASVNNTVSIKRRQAPYNYVTRNQATTLSTGMKTAESYKSTTKLCSSYAWDTAINFIQNKASNYATTSPQGNYNNTTFNYLDIVGTTQTKALSSNILILTGETTPVCNIYDMGGNEWEWTTETSSNSSYPSVYRGGGYNKDYSVYPASYRCIDATASSGSVIGFRVTLYM